ncbi:MAG: peptidylprolyl isomerase [Gammaproteobacteria bacterium]|nr:peptidylprolyl isomerase [Gammaproteobacteria bacterium]MBQ0839465.1 peptidylprolyl isomerase [Gammaproteobacteria bacterium]
MNQDKASPRATHTKPARRRGWRTLGLGLLLGATTCWAELVPLDGIAAIVNEDVVMDSELRAHTEQFYRQLQRQAAQQQQRQPTPPKEALVSQVLDKLILDRIQLAMAERAGIKIGDKELNEALTRTAEQQNMSFDQFVAMAHNDGLSLAQLRQQFSQDMIIGRVQQGMVKRRIEISDQEVENFLHSEEGQLMTSPDLNVGHILLTLPSSANPAELDATLERSSQLRQQAIDSDDFRNIAILNSRGPNALKGGDLGWRKAIQLPALFSEALAKLEPGEVSPPLQSDAGIHLLKLYERRGGGEQLIQQVNNRHILIKPNEILSKEGALEKISALRARIVAGEDFADLAREFSEDPGTALKGGDLGWSTPGQFVPIFESTSAGLKVDEISEPVFSQFGWHIIQVTGRRSQDFSEKLINNQARNALGQRKYAEELPIWLQEIRSEAFVDIRL